MNGRDFDVIIVGARCAGATLATFLARAGASVLLLDRSALPSEHVLSTHTLHPAGMRVLDEIGVGAAVRAVAPPMTSIRLRKEWAEAIVELHGDLREYCPRRLRLDSLLLDAASKAGAEVRDATRVVSLLRDGERVVGVRTRSKNGDETDVRAPLVVGADGRSSTVAELVGAEETIGYDAPRAMYWGYFPAPRGLSDEMYIGYREGRIRVLFHTDDGAVLVGALPPVAEVLEHGSGWRADSLAALRREVASDPSLHELELGAPLEPIRGVVRSRYFFRRAAGPGWALAGDAGVHKEFLTGDGMSEAFIQARALSRAILAGGDGALERFWHARDRDALPWFWYGRDQGALGPRPALEVVALDEISRDPRLCARVAASLDHTISPYDVVSPARALWWMAKSLARGRFETIGDFARMGRRGTELARAIAGAERRLTPS